MRLNLRILDDYSGRVDGAFKGTPGLRTRYPSTCCGGGGKIGVSSPIEESGGRR